MKTISLEKLKKLISEIAFARIKEIADLIIFQNINANYYLKETKSIFLEIDSTQQLQSFNESYKDVYSFNNGFKVDFVDKLFKINLF